MFLAAVSNGMACKILEKQLYNARAIHLHVFSPQDDEDLCMLGAALSAARTRCCSQLCHKAGTWTSHMDWHAVYFVMPHLLVSVAQFLMCKSAILLTC